MTYKGKTIKKHQRGNRFVRVRCQGKVVSIYGRTQIDCYDKLKVFAEKVEIDKAQRLLTCRSYCLGDGLETELQIRPH